MSAFEVVFVPPYFLGPFGVMSRLLICVFANWEVHLLSKSLIYEGYIFPFWS